MEKEAARLRIELMYERALRTLEKQNAPMGEYVVPARVIKEKLRKKPTLFQSAPEIVAAMELLRNHVLLQRNATVAGHKVDLLLPGEKIALEIDGYMHDQARLEDYQLDRRIRESLGVEWEVVRIPVCHVEKNVRQLLRAIRDIKAYKRQVRNKHAGIIPRWYSKRNDAAWREIEKILGVA
jgi:very-short-patch-repair endonuclease